MFEGRLKTLKWDKEKNEEFEDNKLVFYYFDAFSILVREVLCYLHTFVTQSESAAEMQSKTSKIWILILILKRRCVIWKQARSKKKLWKMAKKGKQRYWIYTNCSSLVMQCILFNAWLCSFLLKASRIRMKRMKSLIAKNIWKPTNEGDFFCTNKASQKWGSVSTHASECNNGFGVFILATEVLHSSGLAQYSAHTFTKACTLTKYGEKDLNRYNMYNRYK